MGTDTDGAGEVRLFLLICFELLLLSLIWWGGYVRALGRQPEHRDLDLAERRRRADWVRDELEQRPWWWLMLSGLAMIVLVDWFTSRWERPAWRVAMLWTLTMAVALVVVVTLTVHFGWGMRPVGL
jgi:hypothetical protein